MCRYLKITKLWKSQLDAVFGSDLIVKVKEKKDCCQNNNYQIVLCMKIRGDPYMYIKQRDEATISRYRKATMVLGKSGFMKYWQTWNDCHQSLSEENHSPPLFYKWSN